MMLHGEGCVPWPDPHDGVAPEGLGKAVRWPGIEQVAGSQQSWPGPKETVPSLIVPLPGVVTPFTMRLAPVGTAAGLVELEFWRPNSPRNVSRTNDEWMTLAPPRTTVVPFPVTSQAKPTRGEKSVRSGFHTVSKPGWPC